MPDNTLFIIVLTFVGTVGGGFGLWLAPRTLPKVRGGLRKLFRWLLRGAKWPFAYIAGEVGEWRGVSGYRHRSLTWDDLPQDSKDQVQFHALSESARRSIKLSDLPQSTKYNLLHTLVLPEFEEKRLEGRLQRLDNNGYPELTRDVELLVNSRSPGAYIDQAGMQVGLEIIFASIQEEIPCQPNTRFMFHSGQIVMAARVLNHHQPCPGRQQVSAWISHLSYKALPIFEE